MAFRKTYCAAGLALGVMTVLALSACDRAPADASAVTAAEGATPDGPPPKKEGAGILRHLDAGLTKEESDSVVWWESLSEGERQRLTAGLDTGTEAQSEARISSLGDRAGKAVLRRVMHERLTGVINNDIERTVAQAGGGPERHWRDVQAEREAYRNALRLPGAEQAATAREDQLDY